MTPSATSSLPINIPSGNNTWYIFSRVRVTTTESHILENSPSWLISAFIFYQVWEIPKLWSRSERNHRLRTTEDPESELRLRFVQCYKACIFALTNLHGVWKEYLDSIQLEFRFRHILWKTGWSVMELMDSSPQGRRVGFLWEASSSGNKEPDVAIQIQQ